MRSPFFEPLEPRLLLSVVDESGKAIGDPFVFEFSVDIGSDAELSDPQADGDEGFDPGDVYLWQSGPVTPPDAAGGRDGFKDDEAIFGRDPSPDPPDSGVPPATAVPVGEGDPGDYASFFDLDGHDQLDVYLDIPVDQPLTQPIGQFASSTIFPAENLMVSYDDDGHDGWPAGDVAVTTSSPTGGYEFGQASWMDEIHGLTVIPGAPGTAWGYTTYGIADEGTVHQGLLPNPTYDGDTEPDDDVDSLDILSPDAQADYWYYSADHEANFGLDPGDIYVRAPGMPAGTIQLVVDAQVHLGLPDGVDVDAFEFVWLPTPDAVKGPPALALLFSVDGDDSLTTADESGGLMPEMIYASFLDGQYYEFLLSRPWDDVDAITVWGQSLEPSAEMDFGDAPDTAYPTLLADDGARHVIDGVLYLGEQVDADADGQGWFPFALGDDQSDGTDDEDGVTFLTPLVPGMPATVRVVASADGYLDAWIDFRGDQNWSGPFDQIFAAEPVVAGINDLNFSVPAPPAGPGQPGAVPGMPTFARFRLSSSDAGLAYTGQADDGEVEDEMVFIEPLDGTPLDFGDAPDPSYPTLLGSNGARHIIDRAVYLGAGIDDEPNGQPSIDADGDDLDSGPGNPVPNFDDEDGVRFLTGLYAGRYTTIEVIASVDGEVDAFIDFDQNGDWGDFDDHLVWPVSAGLNTLSFLVPATAVVGDTYARFRFSRDGGLPWYGPATDGEVEDYKVSVNTLEIDSFPEASMEMTLIGPTGSQEAVSLTGPVEVHVMFDGPNEGDANDSDGDGLEDVQTEMVSLDLTGTSSLGPVNVRLHFGPPDVGQIEEQADHTADTLDVAPFAGDGSYVADSFFDITYEIELPQQGLVVHGDGPTHMGGEITHKPPAHDEALENPGTTPLLTEAGDPSGWVLGPTRLVLNPAPQEQLDWGDAPDPSFPTLDASNGASHTIVPGFFMGAGVDAEADGQPTFFADGDDLNDGSDDEDGIDNWYAEAGVGGSVDVLVSEDGYLDAWVDFDRNGDWDGPSERIFTAEPVLAGWNTLPFTVPADAVTGLAVARFRFSSVDTGLPYDGHAPDGEVEDHEVYIKPSWTAKWEQYPDYVEAENIFYGWNEESVHRGESLAADDWLCETNEPVAGITWWGSFIGFTDPHEPPPLPDGFHLAIWSDVPADPDPWSHPGRVLWQSDPVTSDVTVTFVGWDYDPFTSSFEACYRFDYWLPEAQWFQQDPGDNVYWLSIGADYTDTGLPNNPFGWKTRERDPASLAPDAAVTITSPTTAQVGEAFASGQPIQGPYPDEQWDLAFALHTTAGPAPAAKWDQPPTPVFWPLDNGWDEWSVYGGEQIVADDWVCLSPDPVTDVHWWGSYRGWDGMGPPPVEQLPESYHIGIWTDVPASFQGFSHPGELIWEYDCADVAATFEGWEKDPRDPLAAPESVFYYECYLPEQSWFWQPGDEGVYWVSISARYPDGSIVDNEWGWLTVGRDPASLAPDDAVRIFSPTAPETNVPAGPWTSDSDAFPNLDGMYESADTTGFGETGIVLGGMTMVPDAASQVVSPPTAGQDQADSFFDVFVEIDLPGAVDKQGQFLVDSFFDVFTELSISPRGGQMGTWDTEIVSMSLSGDIAGTGIMLRESPTLASTGAHTITDLGDGQFQVDSFFDVFTELSVDGGETWTPADGPIRMAGSALKDFYAEGEPIYWPTLEDSWDMAFILTTQEIPQELDWGDAPDSDPSPRYPTLASHNGAYHVIGGPWLGDDTDAPDAETDGQPNADATGDDVLDLNDDEDGVTIPILVQGQTATITVEVNDGGSGTGGVLEAWIDWNGDDAWDASEIIHSAWLPDGVHNINVTVPATAVVGRTFGRFRISTAGGLTWEGGADDGEVEDHVVTIEAAPTELDWGDAPDSPFAPGYPTLAINNGANHLIDPNGPWLGDASDFPDADPDGQPDPNALGDDNDGNDDEDGIVFLSPLMPGREARVEVTASQAGILNGWLDAGQDSSWAELGDHVLVDVNVPAGTTVLNFTVPAGAILGPTFTRFRLSSVAGLPSTGPAPDGEVEDYEVEITPQPTVIKWDQPPDLAEPDNHYYGWNEVSWHGGEVIAGDDWVCTDPGPVTAVKWWGSFLGWTEADLPAADLPGNFHFAIWTDVAADPPDQPWSHPGRVLWTADSGAGFTAEFVGWDYDPIEQSYEACFEFEYVLPEQQWFSQQEPETVLWLTIGAEYAGVLPTHPWGWKTLPRDPVSPAPDDAVMIYQPTAPNVGDFFIAGNPIEWNDQSWDLAFELQTTSVTQKWSQPPERYLPSAAYNGWDELSVRGFESPQIVADDWLCTTDAPVTDIHWLGSFIDWSESLRLPQLLPDGFQLTIWTDVAVGPDIPFSHPGKVVWEYYHAADWGASDWYQFAGWDIDPRGEVVPEATFAFNIDLPEQAWFRQDPGEHVYWLGISAVYPDEIIPPEHAFGWKTRPRDPESPAPDDAVRIFDPTTPVHGSTYVAGEPIEELGISWDMVFWLTTKDFDGPRVVDVLVRGTDWTAAYLADLEANGLGDADYGYRIPVGSAAQLDPLAWGNIDQVTILFDEPVAVAQGDLDVIGSDVPLYATTGMSYSAADLAATWTLGQEIGVDSLRLELADSVLDMAGNRLDGEWTDTTSVYPSGDGIAGTDFEFSFNVVGGDANGDGKITFWDYLTWKMNVFTPGGAGPATGDFTGDGIVDRDDFAILAANSGKALPAPPPKSIPVAAATVPEIEPVPVAAAAPEAEPTAAESPAPSVDVPAVPIPVVLDVPAAPVAEPAPLDPDAAREISDILLAAGVDAPAPAAPAPTAATPVRTVQFDLLLGAIRPVRVHRQVAPAETAFIGPQAAEPDAPDAPEAQAILTAPLPDVLSLSKVLKLNVLNG